MKYLKYNIPIITSVTLCIVALIVTASKETLSFDTYWHLAMGIDYLNLGDPFLIDHFTFTHFGETIKGIPVIFQLILSKFVLAFGFDDGLFLFKASVFFLFLIAVYFLYKTNKTHTLAILATLPFIVYFLMLRGGLARPELISYVFLIIFLTLYCNAIRDFNSKNLAIISIFLIIWLNYHSAIFGYIIIFFLFVEKGIFKLKRQESFSWTFYFIWAFIIFLTGFANKNLSHFIIPLSSSSGFSDNWKYFIAEYQSLSVFYPTSYLSVFFGASIFLSIWLLIKQKYGMLFITVLLVSQTLNIARLLAFSGIVISFFYSVLLSELIEETNLSRNTNIRQRWVKQTLITIIVLISIVGHLFLGYTTYQFYKNKNQLGSFPTGIVNHLKQTYPSGNIFNTYGLGGYLAYYLRPDFKTYIDGRTNILFSVDFYRTYLHAQHSSAKLENEIEKYNINFTILQNTPVRFEVIANTKSLTVDYVDQFYFLATTGTGNFPISGRILMQPACWDLEITPDLNDEIEKGIGLMPATSPLRSIHEQLRKYSQTSDKIQFFQDYIDGKHSHDDYTKRVLAYLALKQGYIEKSLPLFASIKNIISTDKHAMAIALIKQEKYINAYQMIQHHFLPISNLKKYTSSERETIFDILKILSASGEVEIDDPVLEKIKDVKTVEVDTIQNNLCKIRKIPTNISFIDSDYIKALQSQDEK